MLFEIVFQLACVKPRHGTCCDLMLFEIVFQLLILDDTMSGVVI